MLRDVQKNARCYSAVVNSTTEFFPNGTEQDLALQNESVVFRYVKAMSSTIRATSRDKKPRTMQTISV